jgi:hypothetical protein
LATPSVVAVTEPVTAVWAASELAGASAASECWSEAESAKPSVERSAGSSRQAALWVPPSAGLLRRVVPSAVASEPASTFAGFQSFRG